MKPTTILCLIFVLFSFDIMAQKLPTTNVYLFDLKIDSDSSLNLSNATYLTDFNNKGYNNQPHFMNEEELYLTVQMEGDTSQTDIYSLNFKTGVKTQVTDTPESEYSPTLQYGSSDFLKDNPQFSCVRVALDEESSQRLWSFPMDRSNGGKVLFEGMTGIGYHGWVADEVAALFIVGTPHRLLIANNLNNSKQNIGTTIGRCLQRGPKGNMYYVRKLDPETWYIRSIDRLTRRTTSVMQTLPDVEDFVVLEDGSFLMAKGNKLYRWNKKHANEWKEVADFGFYGLGNITRLAVYKDKYLAIVNKNDF
ncbi:MAG: hypothetical protein AB8F74_07590 [Saprospiraceae bacterium]